MGKGLVRREVLDPSVGCGRRGTGARASLRLE